MFDRRELLLAGAAMLGGCAGAAPGAPEPEPDPAADTEFRDLVARLADRSRAARPFLLRRFDAARLTPHGRVLYEALLPGADADAALTRFSYGRNGSPYAVTHRNGVYRRAAELRPEDDHRAGARAIIRESAQLEGEASRGIVPPDFVIDAAIPAVEEAYARVRASTEAEHEQVAEALARQIETLRGLRTQADGEAGVWRLPDGEDYYAIALQFRLGAAIDPRLAHAQALDRCRALQAEAAPLLEAEGRNGDFQQAIRSLAADHLTIDSDAGKDAAVAEMRAQLARVQMLMSDAFAGAERPAAELRRLPASREANGTMGRRQGPVYYVDLGAPRPSWSLPSVVHHETLPGHILQSSFEGGAAAPELQLRYCDGYGEGWAIYAEQLADELGAFVDNRLARLGLLQWMLFRMARIAVDTGIHVMRWDRARAIQEMRALQGDSIAFVSIEDDIVRVCAQPGVAAAQGLAALHIADLRERTRRSVRGFTLARFHTAMLRHGPLAPPGLEQAARAEFST